MQFDTKHLRGRSDLKVWSLGFRVFWKNSAGLYGKYRQTSVL